MYFLLVVSGILFGVINADSIGYHVSRILSWRKSAISGEWVSEFEREGEIVSETIQFYGFFGNTTWGVLQVQNNGGAYTKPYRIKVVQEHASTYSVLFKPKDRFVSDIGTGTMVFDQATASAQGIIVGFDSGVNEPVIRRISARRISDRLVKAV